MRLVYTPSASTIADEKKYASNIFSKATFMSSFRVSSLQSIDMKDTTVFSIRKRKMRNHVLMLVRPLGSTLRRGNRPARAALETHLTAKCRAPCPLIAFNRDIDPKNNGNSFFHGEIVFLRRFLPRARLRTSGQRCPRIKPTRTRCRERDERFI